MHVAYFNASKRRSYLSPLRFPFLKETSETTMKSTMGPVLLSILHLLLSIQELLFLLLSIVFFAIMSSAHLFSAVFPSTARLYFFHDKSFAFYAVLLLIFFICSTSLGFLYKKWRQGWLLLVVGVVEIVVVVVTFVF